MNMIEEIKKLTQQIVEFIDEHDGFSTEVEQHGVSLTVIAPNGTSVNYDVYELLLYTLSLRKLGGDIELNIETDEEGNEVFRINTSAQLNVQAEIVKVNESFVGFKHDTIQSVFLGKQTSQSDYPYCAMTLYKNGNWMRQELVFAEVLYALTHDLKLELEDSVFCFKKIRKLTEDIRTQLKELNDK